MKFLTHLTAALFAAVLIPSNALGAVGNISEPLTSVTLGASADTTLFGEFPDRSFGGADTSVAGRVNTPNIGRTLIRFDLAGLPADATILSAELRFDVTKALDPGTRVASAHRMLTGWTEGRGTSNRGEDAIPGESTWNNRAHPNVSWSTPGGSPGVEFSSAPSTSGTVSGPAQYTLPSTTRMIADVQTWLADPAANHGWMLRLDDEATQAIARRIATREHAGGGGPKLIVQYRDAVRVNSITHSAGVATLNWSGGVGPYLVEKAAAPQGPYSAASAAASTLTAGISATEPSGYFRVRPEFEARYRVTFETTWTPATHPDNYPGSAHWSGIVGAVHDGNVTFWKGGELASTGIKNVAEFGSKSALLNEVETALRAGSALAPISGFGIGTGAGTSTVEITVNQLFPQITLVSMLAPSPDWFAGVTGLNLFFEGQWATSAQAPLLLFDAGTDSGASYASPNQVTSPFQPISQIIGFPANVSGAITPFGTLRIQRID